MSYVVLLRKKFSYIESIPGVLLPHPSSPPFPYKVDHHHHHGYAYGPTPDHHHAWHFQAGTPTHEFMYDHHHQYLNNQAVPLKNITPSMSSLEALLSKLPSVVPSAPANHDQLQQPQEHDLQGSQFMLSHGPLDFMAITEQKLVAKGETDDHDDHNEEYNNNNRASDHQNNVGETSTSMSAYARQQHHFHHH